VRYGQEVASCAATGFKTLPQFNGVRHIHAGEGLLRHNVRAENYVAVVLALVGHPRGILVANQRGQFARFIVLVGEGDIAGPIYGGVADASFKRAIAESAGREGAGLGWIAHRLLINARGFGRVTGGGGASNPAGQDLEDHRVGLVGQPAGGALSEREARGVAVRTGAEAFGVVGNCHEIERSAKLHDLATGVLSGSPLAKR